jgi:predicted enzyme related to lactoylglutathione lyase
MSDAGVRGRFVWYDLMTTDPAKAIEFYTQVTGWGTSVWEGPMPYTMWTNGGAPIGGVMKMPPGVEAPPHWLAYIGTPDVDATVAQATGLGAKVHVQPTDIPSVGRFAVLADPQGAAFAVYSSSNPHAEDSPAKVGEVSWHELATVDYPAALRFYQTLFGWTAGAAMDMGPAGTYQMFAVNGIDRGGIFNKPAEMPGPPAWGYYFRVADLDAALDRVKAAGGQVLNGPMEVPGGDTIAQCLDPQGGFFALHRTVR